MFVNVLCGLRNHNNSDFLILHMCVNTYINRFLKKMVFLGTRYETRHRKKLSHIFELGKQRVA